MPSTRPPGPPSDVPDGPDARPHAPPIPTKRSLSPDALDDAERPARPRPGSPSSSGDGHRYAPHRSQTARPFSRKRSSSRPAQDHVARSGSLRRERDNNPTEPRTTPHRSTSTRGSREVPRRRRSSHARALSSSPPHRARSRSRGRTPTPPPRRLRQDGHGRHTTLRRRHRDEDRHLRPRRSHSRSPSPPIRSRKPLPSQLDSFRGEDNGDTGPPAEKEKERINWKTTGLLAAETNTVHLGSNEKIVLKYNEPPDARKPPNSARWRLYIFQGADALGDVQLSTHSCWLVGREAAVVDLQIEHPSCSKQHAVFQFRYVVRQEKDKEMGLDDFLAEFGEGAAAGGPVREKGRVRPYLLDLESTNGTYLNGERIADRRYIELREKDIIKFGLSEREYVILKE